jgi:hypothetical protein
MYDEWNDLGIFPNMRNWIEEGEGIANIILEDIVNSSVVRAQQAIGRRCGCRHLGLMPALHQLVGDFTPNHQKKHCKDSC